MNEHLIKDLRTADELRAVEELQIEVWGCSERDVVPATMLCASLEVGGVLVGAFDAAAPPRLVGFAYGFVGLEAGRATLHSDMLAVSHAARGRDLGYRLKLAQRERALALGLTLMTWTFDPLQALNAHFNFRKLGVVSDRYRINFYGPQTSSFLHQNGTDRLWVTWPLTSRRVRERVEGLFRLDDDSAVSTLAGARTLVRVGRNEEPLATSGEEVHTAAALAIEIPVEINAVQRERPALALAWRAATRRAFTAALEADFLVTDFFRSERAGRRVGVYLLSYGERDANLST